MVVGELFVNLGIKVTSAAIGTLNAVRSTIGDIGNLSFTAKAGIVGMFYAIQQFTAASAQTGTNLRNFVDLVGVSAQTLQKYQFVAAQAGISNEEMAGSFKGLQNVMTSMRFGKGAPEGLAMLMQVLQEHDSSFDPNRAKTDIEYVMKKLQEYANLEKDISKRNLVMKSFGVSENVISAMSRNSFSARNLAAAPTFSDKEVQHLDKINAAWIRLGIQIKMAIGHFNARYGGELTTAISNIIVKVEKFINVLMHIAEKFHLFEIFGKYIDDWAGAFQAAADAVKVIDNSKTVNKAASSFTNLFTSNEPKGDISRNALFTGLWEFMKGGSFLKGALQGGALQFALDYANSPMFGNKPGTQEPRTLSDFISDEYLNLKDFITGEPSKEATQKPYIPNQTVKEVKTPTVGEQLHSENTGIRGTFKDLMHKMAQNKNEFEHPSPGSFADKFDNIIHPGAIAKKANYSKEEFPTIWQLLTSSEAQARAKRINDFNLNQMKSYYAQGKEKVAPNLSTLPQKQVATTNQNITQTFNFQNDGKDAKQVGNETQQAIKNAFFQIQQGGR